MRTETRTTGQGRGRGVVAVEVAVVLPLVCLLLVGIVSYGYMLSFRQALGRASNAAATAAAVAVTAASAADRLARAEEAVNSGLGNYGVRCVGGVLERDGEAVGTCSISVPHRCDASSVHGSRCVKVALDYQYRDHSPLPLLPGVGLVLPANLHQGSEAEIS